MNCGRVGLDRMKGGGGGEGERRPARTLADP